MYVAQDLIICQEILNWSAIFRCNVLQILLSCATPPEKNLGNLARNPDFHVILVDIACCVSRCTDSVAREKGCKLLTSPPKLARYRQNHPCQQVRHCRLLMQSREVQLCLRESNTDIGLCEGFEVLSFVRDLCSWKLCQRRRLTFSTFMKKPKMSSASRNTHH